jgi:hypothetical protein
MGAPADTSTHTASRSVLGAVQPASTAKPATALKHLIPFGMEKEKATLGDEGL